jgi:hypothetical protein
MSGRLVVSVVEYGSASDPARRYVESWAFDADSEPTGDPMGPGESGPGALPRAIARAMECGASLVVVRPMTPEAVQW